MTDICPREIEVIRASKGNVWTDELLTHTRQCWVCGATAGIMPIINQLLTQSPESRAFPGYQVLWIRAQFRKRQENISLLDLVALIGSFVVGLAGVIGVLILKVPRLLHLVPGFKDQIPSGWTGLSSVGIPVLVIVGGLLLYTICSDVFDVER